MNSTLSNLKYKYVFVCGYKVVEKMASNLT